MERGQKNPIRIKILKDLGEIEKIEIKHDGSENFADWHLDYIELGKSGEKPKIFNFKRWIKAGKIYENEDPGRFYMLYILLSFNSQK